jgi:acetylornithine deacetylase/succinyl-diaminopimelate desuccinylase-like protein
MSLHKKYLPFLKFLILILSPVYLFSQKTVTNNKIVADKKYKNEVTILANNPVIRNAFNIILELESQTKKDHITLTEIAAPPFKEQKRAEKFKEMLQAAGADSIWIDKAGNVIALKKGTFRKKVIVVEGHLDTVFPEGTDVTVKQRGDTLFAPGIGDDTRGLVAVLTILRAMQKANVKTEADIYFVGTTGEEGLGDLRGVKELFNGSIPKIDSYISIDGGGSGEIITKAVGSRRYRITYQGPGGHSYGSFGLANPHNASARAINYFIKDADAFTKAGIKTTYNVGLMGGGTSVNAIPFESWMEIDMRSENAKRLNGIDNLLQVAIQRALKDENKMKRSGADLTVEIKVIGERPTGDQSSLIPLVQRCMASNEVLGLKTTLGVLSTNANIPISKNVPGICIGGGGEEGGAHSLNEWWINKNGHLAIQQALLLLVAEAGLVK